MLTEESIIVSMTSWHKRINNVKPVLESIMKQTLMPTKILLNLCTEDFPRMTQDLPDDLLAYLEEHKNIIEVYWFIENYKAWKKHLHALDIATDNDLIISIDDDHIYPEHFIEDMYVSYLFYGKKHPITINKIMLCHNLWTFNGPGTLYRKKDWGDYKKYLTYDILHKCWEDIFITILFIANDVMIMPSLFHLPPDKEMLYNDVFAFSDPSQLCKTENGNTVFYNMFDSTYKAIEESVRDHYFIDGKVAEYTPYLWNVAYDNVIRLANATKDPCPPMEFAFNEMRTNNKRGNVYNIDAKKLNIDINRKHTKEDLVGKGNRVIITISSWTNRINNVAAVLHNILYNTMPPDIIVLNLARPDFGVELGKNPSMVELVSILPDELYALMIEHPEIQIHWYDDAELKSWKKHLYVMNEFKENDVIICIDDDILYSKVFIETMLKSYDLYDRKYPVSGCTHNFIYGAFAVHGIYTLYTPGFFKGMHKYMNTKIIHMFPEDNHLGCVLAVLGKLMLPVIGANYLVENWSYNENDPNFGNGVFDDAWYKSFNELYNESINILTQETKNRRELLAKWKPIVYNFSYANTSKFLKDYANNDKPYPFGIVYDEIKRHFEENFGDSKCNAEMFNTIDKFIL